MKKLCLILLCLFAPVSCAQFAGEHEAEEKVIVSITKKPKFCQVVFWSDEEYVGSVTLRRADCPFYIMTREEK